MRRGFAFPLSLGLAAVALATIHAARHQLAQLAGVSSSGQEQIYEDRLRLGTVLLYIAWVLAVGAAEVLVASRRNRERNSPWSIIVLLGVFLYLALVP